MVARETEATMITSLHDKRLDAVYQGYPFGQVELISDDCTQPIGSARSGSILIMASTMELTLHSVLRFDHRVSFSIRNTRKKSYVNNALLRHRATLVGILESNLPANSSDSVEYKQISDCYAL